MSGQIVELAPATRVASRKLGPVAGTSSPSPSSARGLRRRGRWRRRAAGATRSPSRGRGRAASIAAGCAPMPTSASVQPLVERARRRRPRRQIPRRAVEEVGARVLDARGLGTGERMSADEARIVAIADDRPLGRADVADRAVGRRRGEHRVQRRAERARPGRATNTSSASATASATLAATASTAPRSSAAAPTPASGSKPDDARAQARARRQPDRAADQPDADDGDLHAGVNALPATAAARSTSRRVLGELIGAQRLRSVADRLLRDSGAPRR